MARNQSAPEVEDVVDDGVEDTSGAVATDTEASDAEKPAKAKKEPARGDLPEGYVTPVQLAKVLTEKGLHTDRSGAVVEVKPQMVYSYMKNAPKEDPFPVETIKDSLGHDRQATKTDDAVAWWERKNARVAERKANATAKAEKKAARAEAKAEGTDGEAADAEPQAVEAE